MKKKNDIYLLAIESSCDDTAASIIKNGEILSNIIVKQDDHAAYGGVVPELASRVHQQHISIAVDKAMIEAKVLKKQLNAIAFTRGPGLLGSLLVGVNFAKAMALALDIPIIEVHHMHAHILAHFAEEPKPSFPFICLTVSGGHTQLVKVISPYTMELLGQTIDDAAGEAFDKTGKLLGLPYPAGPQIDKRAKLGKAIYEFPIPKIDKLDFSFSGLKTAILYFVQRSVKKDPNFVKEHINDICASVQNTIVEILLLKLEKAALQENVNQIAIAGGVSANSELRTRFLELCNKNQWTGFVPAFQYCTDNAAMIAVAAHYKYLESDFATQDITPDPRLKF